MPKVTITSSIVENYRCSEGIKKVDLFDSKTPGLVLEVRKSGGKTYYLRYQDRRKRTRLFKLANARDVTPQQARVLCQQARTRLAMGQDPREEQVESQLIPTFGRFVEEYYLPWIRSDKRSWRTDVSILKNHILPTLQHRYMDEITREEISNLHRKPLQKGAAPSTANRVLIIIRHIFNLAVTKWEIPGLDKNPAARIKVLEENNKRERFLSREEMERLTRAVESSSCEMLKYILATLLFTGARRAEALNARWEDINMEQRTWLIPRSKSGKRRYIMLSEGALEVFTELRALKVSEVWVFPSPRTGRPYKNIFESWDRARKRADLADVRMHDLRHTFASMLVNRGRSLYEVQHLLGHSEMRTTQRYAHLKPEILDEALNQAMEDVPRRSALLGGRKVVLHETAVPVVEPPTNPPLDHGPRSLDLGKASQAVEVT